MWMLRTALIVVVLTFTDGANTFCSSRTPHPDLDICFVEPPDSIYLPTYNFVAIPRYIGDGLRLFGKHNSIRFRHAHADGLHVRLCASTAKPTDVSVSSNRTCVEATTVECGRATATTVAPACTLEVFPISALAATSLNSTRRTYWSIDSIAVAGTSGTGDTNATEGTSRRLLSVSSSDASQYTASLTFIELTNGNVTGSVIIYTVDTNCYSWHDCCGQSDGSDCWAASTWWFIWVGMILLFFCVPVCCLWAPLSEP